MSKIIKLDPHMANLIAAGEVVERPSSVVKELVENAIDAKATRIIVSLIDAGTQMITVTDNGDGMDEIDVELAFERHATSKIHQIDDLYRICSLGFRGEALPSIASVSEVIVKTSTDGLKGTLLELKAGKLIQKQVIPSQKGTQVTVKHLFYNTPARFKHIQSQSTELSHSIDYINKCALAFPNISFGLIHNDKQIMQTTGSGDLLEAIASTYGTDTAKHMIYFQHKQSLYHISGYASDTTITRSSRNAISIIVNGRVIKNRSVVYAVTEGYHNIHVSSRFPVVVLNISVEPSLIDVNIHPSKYEIKFTEEEELKNLISSTIFHALTNHELIPDVSKPTYTKPVMVSSTTKDIVKQMEPVTSLFDTLPSEEFTEVEAFYYKQEPVIIPIKTEEPPMIQEKIESYLRNGVKNGLPMLEYIGQFHGTYLLAQGEEHLFLIDQHAAMERVMYEKITQALEAQSVSIYDLLIPIKLEFPLMEYPVVLEKIQDLQTLGMIVEDFGSGSVLVRSIPSWIPSGFEEEFIRDMINQLITRNQSSKTKQLDYIAKSLSCKQSIKANMYITKLEVKELLKELNQAKYPFTCPHGRPVIVRVSTYEIEKWFKRVI